MKTHILILSLATILLTNCAEQEEVKKIPGEIFISEKIDTAFLNTSYQAKPAEVVGLGYCAEAQVTGMVNTSVPGTYYLDYDYTDAKGNKSATVTRTVHVVENRASFLNGNYDAACSCTAEVADGSSAAGPTITINNYTASISTATLNDNFVLAPMKIGSEYVIPSASVLGNSITSHFYHRNFVVGSGSSTGTLSATKNTFTIETTNYQISPAIKYNCKNSYTKQLAEIENKK